MSADDQCFVAWEEHILCNERGSRVIHFYLRDALGSLVLAVIGTERSVRHMMYVVSDEFLQAYGSDSSINSSTKWRARREVVDWLTSLVSKHRLILENADSQMNDSTQALGSQNLSMIGSSAHQYLPTQMVVRKLKVQDYDIEWSGVAWICAKQLKHYPAFCRNQITIAVHSFVFIMAEEESNYLAYLEDLYEDKKGQKKVRVRWFHYNQEVKDAIPQLNPHPREVFITPHVQIISAECIDGPATVLTPKHYEKCMALVPHTSSSSVHMCFRQFKNNKVKPFTLTKLHGYCNQAILSCINDFLLSKQKVKCHKLYGEDDEEFNSDGPVKVGAKRSRSYKGYQKPETGSIVRSSVCRSQITKCEPTYPKLRLRLSRNTMGVEFVVPQPQRPMSFKVDDKIELLCQDSGIRGCWFRCKVLRTSQKNLKVQYEDVQDVDGSGNLEEWVPAYRVTAPDKLGLRCSGRFTIRPCPPAVSTDSPLEIGAPVDVWWNDGWWEGVVVEVDTSGNDGLRVYFLGEDRLLTFQRNNIRTSRDWVGNKWINIKAKPDILSYISANASHRMKRLMRSTMAEASPCGGSTLLERNVPTTPKLEAVEDEQKLNVLALSEEAVSH